MLVSKDDCLLLVVDLQDKLLSKVETKFNLLKNTEILIKTFKTLSLPIVATEQYPKGLGSSHSIVQNEIPREDCIQKTTFSCIKEKVILEKIKAKKKNQIIICGLETHICILQTAADFLIKKYNPFVVSDAVGSRNFVDHDIAISRLAKNDINIVTTEMIIFELLENSKNDHFKVVTEFIK